MPDFLSDETVRVPLSSIKVLRDQRQRKIFTTDDLEASIPQYGLINPITLRKDGESYILIAGERRFTAFQRLGLPDIPARLTARDLTQVELELLELEENIKRQDLVWTELVDGVLTIHTRYKEIDPSWAHEKTGQALGIHRTSVWKMLEVAVAIREGNERLLDAPNWSTAWNILAGQLERQKEAAAADLQDEIIEVFDDISPNQPLVEAIKEAGISATDVMEKVEGVEEPEPVPSWSMPERGAAPIINGDFFEFATTYSGSPFNLLHCDFPYGIDIQDSEQSNGLSHGTYEDTPELYLALCRALVDNLNRLVSSSAHIIFWHAWKFHVETRQFFASSAPDLWVQDVPLIWHKTDNRGVMADAQRRPRNTTEVALLISRGDRKLIKAVANSYGAPTSRVIHQSEKPVPVLSHYFSMFVDENTRMLDPTSGSANALIAADKLKAGRVLGIEKDPDYAVRSRIAWNKYVTLKKLAEKE